MSVADPSPGTTNQIITPPQAGFFIACAAGSGRQRGKRRWAGLLRRGDQDHGHICPRSSDPLLWKVRVDTGVEPPTNNSLTILPMNLIQVSRIAIASSLILTGAALTHNQANAQAPRLYQLDQGLTCSTSRHKAKSYGVAFDKKTALRLAIEHWNNTKPFGYLDYNFATNKSVTYSKYKDSSGMLATVKATPCRQKG